MKTVKELTQELRKKEIIGYTSSTYTMINDTLVRVSNHLPKDYNLQENNENLQKLFLIFVESDLTEKQIEKHIESDLYNYEVEYLLIDGSYDFNIDEIFNMIERF